MPRTLITGGAGFLGSHLCDRFISEGHEVICMDNLSTGSMENIAHLIGVPSFRFVHYDVTQFVYVEGPLDYILHFASPASPIDYLKLPIQTLKVGSLGTHKALGLAKAKNARFLIASTSETYGDPTEHPQKETYWGNVNPIGIRGVYDEAKRFSEALTMAYHRYHGVDSRIIRIFNTYGERMRLHDGRAIPAFMSQALRGEPITVFGDGSQTRSVCYVSDLIEGIYRLLMSDYNLPVNIGNPDEVTMLDLAKEILEMVQNSPSYEAERNRRGQASPTMLAGGPVGSKIIFEPLPEDDPKIRQPDITLARSLLGWEPKVPRGEGLKRTLKYFCQAVLNEELVRSNGV